MVATLKTLFKSLLQVNHTKVESVEVRNTAGNPELHATVSVYKRFRYYCPHCNRPCAGYDKGTKDRTWRAMDVGPCKAYLHGSTVRVNCPTCGVVVASVPWAFPGSGFTKNFDLSVAWMALKTNKVAVQLFMRIDWKTVGRCIERAHGYLEPNPKTRLDNLVNIGVDETSYRKGYRYVTVVVDHDRRRVVWVHEGHGKTVFMQFLKELTPQQRQSIKVVTGDGARWIDESLAEMLPNAKRCVDPFHVVAWATEALDKVRLQAWHDARVVLATAKKALAKMKKTASTPEGKQQTRELRIQCADAQAKANGIKGTRYSLGKAPENLTANQQVKLEQIACSDKKLYRSYSIKESLRCIFKLTDVEEADKALNKWYFWATHSRVEPMIELARKIKRHKSNILNAIRYHMSNARIEGINNKIALIVRRAYGFRNLQNLFAMLMLECSNLVVPLPYQVKTF